MIDPELAGQGVVALQVAEDIQASEEDLRIIVKHGIPARAARAREQLARLGVDLDAEAAQASSHIEAMTVAHRLPAVLERMEAAHSRMPSGWPRLDQALGGGFRVPSFVIAAARPKAAKSLWAQRVAEYQAAQGGVVYYIDLENGEDRFFARLLCRNARIGHDDLLRAVRPGGTWPDATAAGRYADAQAGLMREAPFYYDERRLSAGDLEAQIRAIRERHPDAPVLVVLDSMQKLPMRNLDQRRAGIDGWLRDLERLRSQYRLVVLAISELKRGTDGYEAKPSSLKESGDLEYTADLVLLFNREDPTDEVRDPPATLWVAYNRDGEEGVPVADYQIVRPFYGLTEQPPAPPPVKAEGKPAGRASARMVPDSYVDPAERVRD